MIKNQNFYYKFITPIIENAQTSKQKGIKAILIQTLMIIYHKILLLMNWKS